MLRRDAILTIDNDAADAGFPAGTAPGCRR
jgi:hypothetical protein